MSNSSTTIFSAALRRSIRSLYRSPRAFSSPPFSAANDDLPPPPSPPREDDLRSRIFRLRLPKRSATAALDKWVAEGRGVSAPDLRRIARDLRRSQRYKHALEISEWMKVHKEFEFLDSDFAMRIDLMTKVFGISSAEEFFEGLPSAVKFGEASTALLHSYAGAKMVEQAESLFERIKESGFPKSTLLYNEMMTLYMSTGELDKVFLVVEELKQKEVSFDLFTYNLWISACAASQDINGVKRILDEMAQDPNSSEDWLRYMKLANIYVTAGQLVSSDSSLVETGKGISQREWITYDFLIILHAGLGNREQITEIWKSLQLTSHKMTSRNYMCILSAHLVLGQLKEAGELIDSWKQLKTVNFETSMCSRLVDAFVKADLTDVAESLRGLLMPKHGELE